MILHLGQHWWRGAQATMALPWGTRSGSPAHLAASQSEPLTFA